MSKRNLIKDLELGEISAVDRPAQEGALAVLEKGDTGVDGIVAALVKALAPDPNDTLKVADTKKLLTAQLEAGTVTPSAVAAMMVLEARGAALQKQDPTLSAERAFVKAMDADPELAGIAGGY